MSRSPRAPALSLLLGLGLAACLDPLVDDARDPRASFGPADVDPATIPHVEDDPGLADRVASFPRAVPYLRGFADGEEVRYWNVPGPNARFVAPMYVVVGLDGTPVGAPVIDVLPGDRGYSPWWRQHVVQVTEAWAGERLWSREAIEAATRLGLVREPVATEVIVSCPVVARDVRVEVGGAEPVAPTLVWYRGRRAHWLRFSGEEALPVGERAMSAFPVYVFQRVDQAAPIYELVAGVDLDRDGVVDHSNNVFAGGLGSARYSPLWTLALVRTSADFPSIDTAADPADGRGPGYTAEADFFDADRGALRPEALVGSSSTAWVLGLEDADALVNCPIQRTRGAL